MGDHSPHEQASGEEHRTFLRALLDDVQALEQMLETGTVESGARRIGAEQEVFLVDDSHRPSHTAVKILERLEDERFTTELGLFNLEINLTPREFAGGCLSGMESELEELLGELRAAAREERAGVALVGILPTLDRSDLTLSSMTPNPRYRELARLMRELRGSDFRTHIKGVDTLETTHDNVMLESCNTSFQAHFQVAPEEFAALYNLAQVVTAPVLALAANSPVLLRRRLWHETRVALMQQSIDTRSEAHTQRGGHSRVRFGDRWVDDSVLEIFKEDIARFRVMMTTGLEEAPRDVLARGEIPALKALCLHNGTIYRWNRPCYGVHLGNPHLRIENRVLPAGPTVLDEIANCAFYFGLLCGLSRAYPDIRNEITFDHAHSNFTAAARYGIEAPLHWRQGRTHAVRELVLGELLPAAREGLLAADIRSEDVDRYLGVIEGRVTTGRTGAVWALDSLAGMSGHASGHENHRSITQAMVENSVTGRPVHTWDLATGSDQRTSPDSCRRVGQVMTTDLFTVAPEDLVDLAASLMDWKHVRHVPVEDSEGRLVGLVSHRRLLRLLGGGMTGSETRAIQDIMEPDPVTVSPETPTLEAIQLMRKLKVSGLPVVENGKLVGIVTERDFIDVAAQLVDRWLRDPADSPGE